MTSLPDQIVALHVALRSADVPHAFGGALALAWCTERARGTIDIDLNLFVEVERAAEVLAALPPAVAWSDADRAVIERRGQTRLWWEGTPVDVFFNTTEFHVRASARCRWERFGGETLPFLTCADLAVFKAFFNRTRDWADLEEMTSVGTLDVDQVIGVLSRFLGSDDPRIERLRTLG